MAWTARHPEWTPDEDWPPEVACVAYEVEAGLVLIDRSSHSTAPGHSGRNSTLGSSVPAEPRTSSSLSSGMPAARVQSRSLHGDARLAHEPARELVAELTRYTHLFRAGDPLPGGIEAPTRVAPSRCCSGFRAKGRLWQATCCSETKPAAFACSRTPGSAADRGRLLRRHRATAELPVERILPAQCESVLENGREALARAIDERDPSSRGGGKRARRPASLLASAAAGHCGSPRRARARVGHTPHGVARRSAAVTSVRGLRSAVEIATRAATQARSLRRPAARSRTRCRSGTRARCDPYRDECRRPP